MKPLPCPSCGFQLEETTALPGSAPRPAGAPELLPDDGDVSMCLACGDLGIFQVGPLGVRLRQATIAEVDQLMLDPSIVRLIEIRAEVVGRDLLPPSS